LIIAIHLHRTSLEINHKTHDVSSRSIDSVLLKLTCLSSQIIKKAQAGGGVAVKIEHAVYQSAKMYGRHFDDKDEIYSQISRQSIDVLKVRRITQPSPALRETASAMLALLMGS